MRLFANTLTNKAHQQEDYRYLANSIYAEHLLDKNWTLDKKQKHVRNK